MAQRFDLVLTGNTQPGQVRETVAAALAKLLRIPESRALELLSGRETVVKRDLSDEALAPYVAALTKIGAGVRAQEQPPPEATPPMPAPAAPLPAAPVAPPAAASPATERIRCPACGTEQPKRNLCRQCGGNIPRLLAARSEEKREPKSERQAPARTVMSAQSFDWREASDGRHWILTFYRKSVLVEILVFLFLTLWWSLCAMLDPQRSKLVRAIGTLLFLAIGASTVLQITGVFDVDPEEREVNRAFLYAAEVADKVSEYASENQRMPARTSDIALPPGRPLAVKTLSIGRGGTIQVTLGDNLGKSSGGTILVTPTVAEGGISWSCSTRDLPERYLEGCR